MLPPISDTETQAWFATEVQPHEASLRAYLRQAFNSPVDVDDLMQETYLRVLRARARGPIASNKSFLFAVARNAVRDVLRRRAVSRTIPITENEPLAVLEEKAGVVELVSQRQELALLSEAIRALPDRCRQVFLLRKIQDLPQKDIAARLGITENTVETLVAKGARRCREYLRRNGAMSDHPR